jgi:hypothetical protein
MDYSNTVAWSIAVLGGLFTLLCAIPKKQDRTLLSMAVLSGAASLAIGFVLILPAVFLNSYCIEKMFCISHGDGNMAYWFHTVSAVPAYFIIFFGVSIFIARRGT